MPTTLQIVSNAADRGGTSSPDLVEAPRREVLSAYQPPDADTELDLLRRELDVLRRREREHRLRLQELEGERRAGAVMQRELLPREFPRIAGAEIAAILQPADFISGDLHDVVRLDGEHVALMVLDATGHGIAAALLAGHARRVLRGLAREAGFVRRHPDEVLSHLNEEILRRELADCSFVAALYAVYHEPSSTIRWARGGVPYPILCRPGSMPRKVLSEGPIVGACEDARFAVVEMKLRPGDTLVFHTDGWDEPSTMAVLRDAFVASLAAGQRSGLSEELSRLECKRAGASHGEPPADDLTLLALRVDESSAGFIDGRAALTLAAS